MFSLLCLIQVESSPSNNHSMTVIDEMLEDFSQRENTWLSIYQSQHICTKARLHLSVLVEFIQHNRWYSIPLQLYYYPKSIPVRFVSYISDFKYLLVPHQLSSLFYQPRFIDHERDLSHDNTLRTRIGFFNLRTSPHEYPATPFFVCSLYTIGPTDEPTRRKIWTFHYFKKVLI